MNRDRLLRAAVFLVIFVGLALLSRVIGDRLGLFQRAQEVLEATEEQNGAWETRADEYFTVKDAATGTVLFYTSHYVFPGDEYIDQHDERWVVVRVAGTTAEAESRGKMEALPAAAGTIAAPVSGKVAVYHTHSDESYVPEDGTDSRPGSGGVMKVGANLVEGVKTVGLGAVHDTTSHDPHDAQAYDRSRRTAQRLLRTERPLALFDVHRDAGPPEPYLTEQKGELVARAMIVVGRQNPKMRSNLEFARRLKDAVNSKYPGLIKGIFVGNADFNQDLFERSLLLEVGTEKTPRTAAERGARLIAEVVPSVLTAAGPGAARESGGAGRTLLWLVGAVVAGIFVYLWVSTGSWEEMKSKILGWFGSGGVRLKGGRGGGLS